MATAAKTSPLVFDIETEGLPLDRLKEILPPFDPSAIKNPGKFDTKSVKISHLKDPEKINAKIEGDRQKHADLVKEYEDKMKNGETDYWSGIQDKAALSATTGKVLAIGYRGEEGKQLLDCVADDFPEAKLLTRFWNQFKACHESGRKMVGYNIAMFDIPFLTQRSWILNVDVPANVYTQSFYLDSTFVDLMKVWQGSNRNGYISLNEVCRACGIGKKPDGVTGKDFARLYTASPETRQQALDYLANDLDMPCKLAERLKIG